MSGRMMHPRCGTNVCISNDSAVRRGATVAFEEVLHPEQPQAQQEQMADLPASVLYSQTLVAQAHRISDCPDLVEFFASIRYHHVVPQIVRDGRRAPAPGGPRSPPGGRGCWSCRKVCHGVRTPSACGAAWAWPGLDRTAARAVVRRAAARRARYRSPRARPAGQRVVPCHSRSVCAGLRSPRATNQAARDGRSRRRVAHPAPAAAGGRTGGAWLRYPPRQLPPGSPWQRSAA